MSMKTLFRHAIIVNADGSHTGDVLVCNDKIERIGDHIEELEESSAITRLKSVYMITGSNR